MENFLTKTFYNDNEFLVTTISADQIIQESLKKQNVTDKALEKTIKKLLLICSSMISNEQKLSMVLKDYLEYHKVIITVSGNMNFQISIDKSQNDKSFIGYIASQSEENTYNGYLDFNENMDQMIDAFLQHNQQINWFFDEEKLIVPMPNINQDEANKLLSKATKNELTRSSYFEYKIKNECNCSKEKYLLKMRNLNQEELDFIFNETDEADIICDWCKADYIIKREEVETV